MGKAVKGGAPAMLKVLSRLWHLRFSAASLSEESSVGPPRGRPEHLKLSGWLTIGMGKRHGHGGGGGSGGANDGQLPPIKPLEA